MWKWVICVVAAASVLSCAEESPLRIEPAVANRNLVKKVDPVVPPLAKLTQVGGTVVADAYIDQNGNVTSVSLISGHPMLAPAFIEAVKKWEYRPFLNNERPVPVVTRVEWTVATPKYSPEQENALKDYYPTFQTCYDLVKKGDQGAEMKCRAAVTLADELPENRVLERSDSRTFLAHALFRQRKLDEAIPLYEQALQIGKGYENSDRDADFASENANLARAYFVSGQAEKADSFYSQAVTIFKAAIANLPEMKDNYSNRLKQTLLEYSKVKTARGQADEAAKLEDEADRISAK